MNLERFYRDAQTQLLMSCRLRTSLVGTEAVIHVSVEGECDKEFRGHDFEEAMDALRRDFDAQGRLILINRFRREAFVTPMSRQMSNGLSCYLVEPRRPVDPSRLVACLDSAEERDVVSEHEARAFIACWPSEPPWNVRFPWLGWIKDLVRWPR